MYCMKYKYIFYKNLIKGAYDRNSKYVKRPSTRKRKPKKYSTNELKSKMVKPKITF